MRPWIGPLALLALTIGPHQSPTVTTLAGDGRPGFAGDGAAAGAARLDQPFDAAFDRAGDLFVTDTGNHRIRRIDAGDGTITTIAGNGRKGFDGDGGPALEASLNEPYGLAIDADGTIYFADRLNGRVRRIDGATGTIATVAGDGSKSSTGDDGPAATAGLVEPNGVALDGRGHLAIADVAGHRVRLVDLATGTIQTIAGNGQGRHDGDDGPADRAALNGPRAVEYGPDGTLYILERNGNTLRAIDPASGAIRTIAGTGRKGYTGDGGPARMATFDGPKELAIGPDRAIYIVDTENHAIRRIDQADGSIATVAGGRRGPGGDGGPATAAGLDRPHGVAVGPDGSIVIGDTNNHRVRRVGPPGSP